MNFFARIRVDHDGTNGHFQRDALAVLTCLVRAFAVTSALRLVFRIERKWTSVLWRSLDSMMTSPPLPPSPPEGPPRGTNFSRRNAMQPLPPSPALIRIVASSIGTSTITQPTTALAPKTQQPLEAGAKYEVGARTFSLAIFLARFAILRG